MQGGRGEATLAGVSVAQATQGRWEEAVQAAVEGLEMVRLITSRALVCLLALELADLALHSNRTPPIRPPSQTL
jgi:hypothetical protein